jgi:hemerythrin-like metal-binding protein
MSYPKIVWTDKMLCGNAKLDQQHRELANQTNALIDLAEKHKPEEAVCRQAIDKLIKDIWSHFLEEETVIGYLEKNDYDAHVRDHAKYWEKLTRLNERPEDIAKLLDLLVTGMTRHIQYGDFSIINDGVC